MPACVQGSNKGHRPKGDLGQKFEGIRDIMGEYKWDLRDLDLIN